MALLRQVAGVGKHYSFVLPQQSIDRRVVPRITSEDFFEKLKEHCEPLSMFDRKRIRLMVANDTPNRVANWV